ncbi:MAG: hypothetical protein N2036_03555 [Bryobacteraceae bacterium]|nr:hypothetical protein [Bryobacteraceae bacterium]MCX7603130.1 hypothetical protein [Bryobacteraceae bacterium]
MDFDAAVLRKKLRWALAAYAALAVMAALTLDGLLLHAVLLFLGALAVRSWVAVKREELE